MIYFDNAATTPPHPQVIEVIDRVLREEWGNPSSLHHKGFEAEQTLRASTREMARILGVAESSIIFTSCATESNNTALRGAVWGKDQPNILVPVSEHSSVYTTARHMAEGSLSTAARGGVEVRFLPVDAYGRVRPDQVRKAIDARTALVAVMQVNNELGSLNPIAELGQAIKEANPKTLFHVDATQALGKFPIPLAEGQVDSFAASAHKIHGPKGIGLLYVRPGLAYPPLLDGGGQMDGRRAGTENVAYIAGFAKALSLMDRYVKEEQATIWACYERACERIGRIPGARLNSPTEAPVNPFLLNVGILGIKAEVLLHMMEEEAYYFSSGSACSLGKASRVIEAIGLSSEYGEGILRISFGMENRPEEVDPFFDALEKNIARIRQMTGWRQHA